jgi:hypothetical protein
MRMPSKVVVVALLALTVFSLSGCARQPVRNSTPAGSSSPPVFASDEEALAAATAAYARYLAVVDQVAQDGGKRPERLDSVEVNEALVSDKTDLKDYTSHGYRSTGSTTIDSAKIQSVTQPAGPETLEVSIYICEDVSGIDLFGPDGSSLVSLNRIARTGFQAEFVSAKLVGEVLLSAKTLWTGAGFC